MIPCDDVNQDKHIMEAFIWISFNKKSVYMHVLFLHAAEQPYSKVIIISIILDGTIITCNHTKRCSLIHDLSKL